MLLVGGFDESTDHPADQRDRAGTAPISHVDQFLWMSKRERGVVPHMTGIGARTRITAGLGGRRGRIRNGAGPSTVARDDGQRQDDRRCVLRPPRLAVDVEWMDQSVASHLTNRAVDRTRPLCPYGKVAKYKANGSTDLAANFACADSTVRGTR